MRVRMMSRVGSKISGLNLENQELTAKMRESVPAGVFTPSLPLVEVPLPPVD